MEILPNQTHYIGLWGDLRVVGEIKNNRTQPIYFIKITLNLFDASGQLLATSSTFTRLYTLTAGDRTCFSISFDPPPAGWTSYQFETPTYYVPGQPVSGLVAFNDSGIYNTTFGWYEIIGQIRNDSTKRIKSVKAVSTLYNDIGTAIGCGSGYVSSDDLEPGQTSAFKIITTGRDYRDVGSYRLQAEGSP